MNRKEAYSGGFIIHSLCYLLFLIVLQMPLFALSYSLEFQDIDEVLDSASDLDSLRKEYNSIGLESIMTGDYQKAKEYLHKALEIKKLIFSEYDEVIGNNHVNLGVIYLKIWEYETALSHFDSAEYIYSISDNNEINIASLYVNKAVIYRVLHDYGRAIEYYNSAIRLFNSNKPIDYPKLGTAYFNLALVYEYINENEQAIEYFKKSILIDRGQRANVLLLGYNRLAVNYDLLERDDLAKEYYLKSINIAEDIYDSDDYRLADLYTNYAIFLVESDNQPLLGFSYYKKALELNVSKFGIGFPSSLICLNNIAEYFITRNVDSSLYYSQTSIKSGYPGLVSDSIGSNPDVSNLPYNPKVMTALKTKSEALLIKYIDNNDIEYLELCLNTLLIVYDLIDKVRLRYESETSTFFISEMENSTFIKGIQVALMLYDQTKDDKYIKVAFDINERRRAFTLLASIRNVKAKKFGGIPPKLLIEENTLSKQLAAYEELLYEEKKRSFPDQRKILLWEQTLFQLTLDYERLINLFEKEFPEYYKLKYDASVIDFNHLKNSIDKNTSLVEYVLNDTSIIIIVISSEGVASYTKTIDDEFNNSISYLSTYLSQPNFSSDVKQTYKEYTEAAYKLYEKLIAPCQKFIQGNSLIIIPDGILSYVPFEALLSYKVNPDNVDYRNLPYLIRDYTIGYSYSATLHFEGHRRERNPTKNLLAFAPDYSYNLAQNDPEPSYLEEYRDNLVPLPGVKDEVSFITRLIDGDVYLDELATESNFKEHAEQYDILHLAMHTIVDNENPMYSKLAFTQNVDSVEDGFLNTYEIYNMKYNARLAVLSSCKTGFGKLQKGEGVMSLARGFMYAGCPSIIMTLWEVSDKSGALLMQSFYKYLKRGMSKSEALRKAKLDFIINADQLKANPYFWSSYVAIGDTSPIYQSIRKKYTIPALVIVSLLLLSFTTYIYLRRRKKGKEPPNGPFRTDELYTR